MVNGVAVAVHISCRSKHTHCLKKKWQRLFHFRAPPIIITLLLWRHWSGAVTCRAFLTSPVTMLLAYTSVLRCLEFFYPFSRFTVIIKGTLHWHVTKFFFQNVGSYQNVFEWWSHRSCLNRTEVFKLMYNISRYNGDDHWHCVTRTEVFKLWYFKASGWSHRPYATRAEVFKLLSDSCLIVWCLTATKTEVL